MQSNKPLIAAHRPIRNRSAVMCAWLLATTLGALPASAQTWEAVPLVTAESRAAGIRGGEGCQWPQALAAEPQHGQRLLLGTDVGGVYRSEDGGINWQPSNTGLNSRGATAFAFDPANPDRVLLVACNAIEQPFHGIYLSTDGGVSWRNTQPYGNKGIRDFREQVAFDRTSVDRGAGMTRIVYWSAAKTKDRGPAFFKSEDGGVTWHEISGAGQLIGDAIVKVHPVKGWVYAGSGNGLSLSKDGGQTFEKVFPEPVTGLDVVPSVPDRVYLTTAKGLQISEDAGAHFTAVPTTSLPPIQRSGLQRLCVSPADPQEMVIDEDHAKYDFRRYVSHDGGKVWDPVKFDVRQSFVPYNKRQLVVVWHPTDPKIGWSIGGDFIVRTVDGGNTWAWSNSGYNGQMVGSSFAFNALDPDLLYMPSQDYDGSISSDAGHTWKYFGVSGEKWGGFTYGGYAFNATRVCAGSRPGWQGKTELHLNDQGKIVKTGIELIGLPVGAGDPTDAKVGFLYEQRTADGGATWQKMPECQGVLTYDPKNTTTLYGAKGSSVVASHDHGTTWAKVLDLPAETKVRDVACAPAQGCLYIVGGDKLFLWHLANAQLEDITLRLPADQFDKRGAASVATDPVQSAIVYVVRPGNAYDRDTAAARSTDGGKTWVSLNRSQRLGTGLTGPDGGREAMWVRVHPKNRYAYTASNCFGIWRIAAPKD